MSKECTAINEENLVFQRSSYSTADTISFQRHAATKDEVLELYQPEIVLHPSGFSEQTEYRS
jgi:hypothetical protein